MSAMTKREAAERNVKYLTSVKCEDCPFWEEYCTIAKITNTVLNGCREACAKWLKDNPIDNEWKHLEIANLPPDILVGDYEFEYESETRWKPYGLCTVITVLSDLSTVNARYRLRQPEPVTPTHNEIIDNYIYSMSKACEYKDEAFKDTVVDALTYMLNLVREYATIPPEGENK